MLQEYNNRKDDSVRSVLNDLKGKETDASEILKVEMSPSDQLHGSYLHLWQDYVARLSAVLCHFLLEAKESRYSCFQPSISRSTIATSPAYAELSVKWFTRVLLTVFTCIKACLDQSEMPSHLRWTYALLCGLFFILFCPST